MDDEILIQKLVVDKMPLTICPLSNVKLRNVDKIDNHPIKTMLNKGLVVTINSDDPAYFGGYMNENYKAVAEGLDLSKDELYQLTLNSFNSSFLGQQEKDVQIKKLDEYYEVNK